MTTPAARHPLFPKPVSPVDARPLSPTPSDVVASDSEAEVSQEARDAKRRRIEQIAQQYLSGQGIFILSAGLWGPFDTNWSNPWRRVEKRRPSSRNAGDEIPRCASAPERKKRTTDREQGAEVTGHSRPAEREMAEANDGRKRALPGDNLSRGNWRASIQQPERETAQSAIKPREIFKASAKTTPPTETWLRRATTSRRARAQGSVYGRATRLTFEAQATPETSIAKTILPPLRTPEPAEATTLSPKPAGPLGPPTHPGFTPINNSSKLVSHIESVDVDLLANEGGADANGEKPKKRPRHVDFATMSSPNKPKKPANGSDVAPKVTTESKRPNLVKDSKAEGLARVSPSSQGEQGHTAQPLATSYTKGQQQKDFVVDASGRLEALGPSIVTPTAAPNRSWAPHTDGAAPSMRSNQRSSPENNLSTQAEILNAQRLFQAGIPSPEARSPCPPEQVPLEHTLLGTKSGSVTTLRSADEAPFVPPFRSFSGPPICDEANEDDGVDPQGIDTISTQELMDAASPFSFSTDKKKPVKGIFAKRASFVQTPSKLALLPADVENETFGELGLDIETPPEIEESAARPQGEEQATRPTRRETTPTDAPPSSLTVAAGPLPASVAASPSVPANDIIDLSNTDSEEELNNYIDDISNYLDVWDIETELRRVAAPDVPAIATKGILSTEGRRWK
ncbi:MAG: hypothetical protein M1839_003339 [Geoglossum umbratile]|nr:MAG: hypothetical protein M1839_003339 [Geoglossum umbratile]